MGLMQFLPGWMVVLWLFCFGCACWWFWLHVRMSNDIQATRREVEDLHMTLQKLVHLKRLELNRDDS